MSAGASAQSSCLTEGLADLCSGLSVGCRGCNVGKNESEHLGSHLPDGVVVYQSVLWGRQENKCCQPWCDQVLRSRCLPKINGREKSKLGRSPAISSFYDERNADPGTDTASGSSDTPCNPHVLPFVAGGRSVQI